ncbi:hypothetical protein GCM10017056_37430 [Seohaeicola zhoushanensis]|uniref:Uncharacterized protein n=1 Tax=Seohaeicola zhoushanensis TaxID=1569283 RepID=A0A8J3M9W6_9RHOB|nr:hypothetical protein GCM10017056_37430 [Seohaeicola zhoushanensis]
MTHAFGPARGRLTKQIARYRFDLDDLGAIVTETLRRQRAHSKGSHLDDTDALKRLTRRPALCRGVMSGFIFGPWGRHGASLFVTSLPNRVGRMFIDHVNRSLVKRLQTADQKGRAIPAFTRRYGMELSMEATPRTRVSRPTRKLSKSARLRVATRST